MPFLQRINLCIAGPIAKGSRHHPKQTTSQSNLTLTLTPEETTVLGVFIIDQCSPGIHGCSKILEGGPNHCYGAP